MDIPKRQRSSTLILCKYTGLRQTIHIKTFSCRRDDTPGMMKVGIRNHDGTSYKEMVTPYVDTMVDPCVMHQASVELPCNHKVNHMQAFGTWMHPGSFVPQFMLKESVGNTKAISTTEFQQT